jgi:formate transporter
MAGDDVAGAAARVDARAGAELERKAEDVAVAKAGQSTLTTLALGFLAGLFIGLGALVMLFVKSDAALSFAPAQLLGGLSFSLGLLLVTAAGAELFTGNTLMVCAAASGRIPWRAMLRNWALVWPANLAGALFLVFLVYMADAASMNGGAVGEAMVSVAYAKIDLPAQTIFFRAVLCNVLVCLAVWMGFAGRSVIDKVFTTVFPVVAFVACGFEHCIANMFFLPAGIVAAGAGGYAGAGLDAAAVAEVVNLGGAACNILVATAGNIVGGALVVGGLYWLALHRGVRRR